MPNNEIKASHLKTKEEARQQALALIRSVQAVPSGYNKAKIEVGASSGFYPNDSSGWFRKSGDEQHATKLELVGEVKEVRTKFTGMGMATLAHVEVKCQFCIMPTEDEDRLIIDDGEEDE